jgi:hypothetical protein
MAEGLGFELSLHRPAHQLLCRVTILNPWADFRKRADGSSPLLLARAILKASRGGAGSAPILLSKAPPGPARPGPTFGPTRAPGNGGFARPKWVFRPQRSAQESVDRVSAGAYGAALARTGVSSPRSLKTESHDSREIAGPARFGCRVWQQAGLPEPVRPVAKNTVACRRCARSFPREGKAAAPYACRRIQLESLILAQNER